jgi:hypothetical protein
MVTNSPAATSRVTSVMAVNGVPERVANLLVAPRSEIAGAPRSGSWVSAVMRRDARAV